MVICELEAGDPLAVRFLEHPQALTRRDLPHEDLPTLTRQVSGVRCPQFPHLSARSEHLAVPAVAEHGFLHQHEVLGRLKQQGHEGHKGREGDAGHEGDDGAAR